MRRANLSTWSMKANIFDQIVPISFDTSCRLLFGYLEERNYQPRWKWKDYMAGWKRGVGTLILIELGGFFCPRPSKAAAGENVETSLFNHQIFFKQKITPRRFRKCVCDPSFQGRHDMYKLAYFEEDAFEFLSENAVNHKVHWTGIRDDQFWGNIALETRLHIWIWN